jgi:kinetochore protein Nuf2
LLSLLVNTSHYLYSTLISFTSVAPVVVEDQQMSFMLDNSKMGGGRASFLPPRQTYSFPILKTNEIILCLNELGLSVSEDELVNPDKNKDQIRRVYEYLTEYCTGTTREEMSQPAFCGLSKLTYPELHEESIPQINSFRACQKMLEVCGINDFTIKDFMAPNSKRLRKQLSGILNFGKFREERYTLLTELTAERESVLSNYTSAKKKNEQLTQKLAVLREQTKEEAAVISQIEVDCKAIEVTINELNHKQAELREEIADLKEDNTKLKDNLAAHNVQLEESTHTKKKLQGQIVNSPERFRKQIQDVAQSLHTEQQTIRSLERKHRELQAWTLHVDEGVSMINSAQDSLNEVQVEASKHKTCSGELDSRRQKAANTGDLLQNTEMQVQQLTRQTSRAEEKLSLIRKQASERSQDACLAIDQLHTECLAAEKLNKEAKERGDRVVSEAIQIERQVEAEKQMQQQVMYVC